MKDASRMHKLPRRISNCQRDRLGLLAFTVVYRKMEQSIEPKSRLPFNRTSRTAEQCVASGVTQTPFSLPNLRSLNHDETEQVLTIFQSASHITASPGISPQRLDWARESRYTPRRPRCFGRRRVARVCDNVWPSFAQQIFYDSSLESCNSVLTWLLLASVVVVSFCLLAVEGGVKRSKEVFIYAQKASHVCCAMPGWVLDVL